MKLKSKLYDIKLDCMHTRKQGHTLNNWVEGLSDEAYYPWESRKNIRLKSVRHLPAIKRKFQFIDKWKLASFSKS